MANKLYKLSYISEKIEQFATSMLLSAVDDHASDLEDLQSGSTEQRAAEMVGISFFPSMFSSILCPTIRIWYRKEDLLLLLGGSKQ